MKNKKSKGKVRGTALGFAAGLLGVYTWKESRALEISRYEVRDPRLARKLKICQISDFHNRGEGKFMEKLLAALKKEAPDYIFITGDLLDSRNPRPDRALALVRELLTLAPCFYVSGNHEHRLAWIQEIHRAYEDLGLRILDNESLLLEEGLALIGLGDPRVLGPGLSIEEMAAYYKDRADRLTFSKENYQILLVHRPNFLNLFSSYPFDLVFAGHMHGGQIRLPIFGPLLSPYGEFFPDYAQGMVEERGTKEIISRGLGNSSFPIRMNNKPDLVVVNLQGEEA